MSNSLTERKVDPVARGGAEAKIEKEQAEAFLAEEAQKERERYAAMRQADLEHRKKVNWAAAEAMMVAGHDITFDMVRGIINAVAAGEIPGVSITY